MQLEVCWDIHRLSMYASMYFSNLHKNANGNFRMMMKIRKKIRFWMVDRFKYKNLDENEYLLHEFGQNLEGNDIKAGRESEMKRFWQDELWRRRGGSWAFTNIK